MSASALPGAFLWTGETGPQRNRFVAFRHRFAVPDVATDSVLHIFADTRYVAYLNGSYLACGPARFDPRFPQYDSLPLAATLTAGGNALAVLVQSLGVSNAWSIAHQPGLAFVLEWTDEAGRRQVASSGPSTKWSAMEAWDSRAPVSWASALEWFDARRFPQEWNAADFDDRAWKAAVPLPPSWWGRLQPRSIPLLRERNSGKARVISVDADDGAAPSWIWHDEGVAQSEEVDRVAATGPRFFRWAFEAPAPVEAELRLVAGGDFTLFLNGRLVERKDVLSEEAGVVRFSPTELLRWAAVRVWRYDLTRFTLRGANVLAVEVRHHVYESGPRRSPAGLCAQITCGRGEVARSLPSGASWRSSSRHEQGWEKSGFDHSHWTPVIVLSPSGMEPWDFAPSDQAFRVSRFVHGAVGRPFPVELAERDRLVIDFGGTTLARPFLEVEGLEGARLDLSYADTLEATGEPAISFGPDRYVLRDGAQSWGPTDSRGFRYLALTAARGQLRVLSASRTERLASVELRGSFASSHQLLTGLWPRCVETVRVCMEDAYIDTPVRERAQWLADTMACGFHVNLAAFGDTTLYRRMLTQIGESQDQPGADIVSGGGMLTSSEGLRQARERQGPGWVWARYPSQQMDIHSHIEDYMLLWVIGHWDYFEQTLDGPFLRAQWPRIKRLLGWFHARRTSRGLVRARDFVYFGNPVAYLIGEGATLNVFYLLALRAVVGIAGVLRRRLDQAVFSRRARDLTAAIRSQLAHPGSDLFDAMLDGDKRHPPSAHANVLALLAGLVPAAAEGPVLDWIERTIGQERISPYFYYWVFEMLYRLADEERAERLVLDLVRSNWGPLAELGTMREGFSRDSVTHIAGTVPAWVASAGVLGVRVSCVGGVRQVLIRPRLGDLQWAEGEVPTVMGPIKVRHERQGGAWESTVSIPEGVPAWLRLPGWIAPTSLLLDGSLTARGRDPWWIPLAPGNHVVTGRK